jgi:hypothetical protein
MNRQQLSNMQIKNTLWKKAKKIKGKDSTKYRKDPYNKIMYYASYGKSSNMGWQNDHIKPTQRGGNTTIRNMQALNSHINMTKQDSLVKKSRHNQK